MLITIYVRRADQTGVFYAFHARRRSRFSVYTRGGQTFFGHDLLKIYFTFEDRLS